MKRLALALVTVAALSGCECGGATGLVVSLRSNLVPGVEVDEARVDVFGDDQRVPVARTQRALVFGDPLEVSVRVAEVESIAVGTYSVVTSLFRGGSVVAQRTTRVRVRQATALTVLITRDCASLICPEATTCFAGECVPLDCFDGSGFDGCPELECVRDDDCATDVPCSEALCVENRCHAFPRHDACGGAMWCNPDLGCRLLPDVDAGAPGDGGAPACRAGECDDANPCTDDACVDGRCAFTPNTSPCDDGSFCNGADTCVAGSCASGDADPCPGMSTCSEVMDTCEGCGGDADCPPELPGPWGACAVTDPCASTGTQERDVRTYTCVAGSCVPTVRRESQPCTRAPRDGASCGATRCDPFMGCAYPSACAERGSNDRLCTDRVCRRGACADAPRVESMPCGRSTGGTSCGSRTCTGWSACDYSDECDESASQSRTCTDRVCGGGACLDQPMPETRGCSRDTETQRCGSNPTYCGSLTTCHLCQGGVCVVNRPHYDAACNPSCGEASSLCGAPAHRCCPAGSCAEVGPGGPYADGCARCCAFASCF